MLASVGIGHAFGPGGTVVYLTLKYAVLPAVGELVRAFLDQNPPLGTVEPAWDEGSTSKHVDSDFPAGVYSCGSAHQYWMNGQGGPCALG